MAHAEISLQDAWAMLSDKPDAVLIDVRTVAEWNFVGIPDLSSLDKEIRTVEWTKFPTGEQNPLFVQQATDGLQPDQPVLFLCRSGARSRAASQTLVDLGFTDVSNVSAGFEGDLDANGHRHGGWKDSLPWRQS
jgi:rhodanese-related sulfurtransferase